MSATLHNLSILLVAVAGVVVLIGVRHAVTRAVRWAATRARKSAAARNRGRRIDQPRCSPSRAAGPPLFFIDQIEMEWPR